MQANQPSHGDRTQPTPGKPKKDVEFGYPWPESLLSWLGLHAVFYVLENGFQILLAYATTASLTPLFLWAFASEWVNSSVFLYWLALFVLTYILSLSEYFAVSTMVDLLADSDWIFPPSIRFSSHKRDQLRRRRADTTETVDTDTDHKEAEQQQQQQQHEGVDEHGASRFDYSHRQYLRNHLLFTARWAIPIAVGSVIWIPRFHLVHNPPVWMIPLKVQLSLIFADLAYWVVHYSQHRWRWVYKWTDHTYHHTFQYPWGSAGTWLGTWDLMLSALSLGSVNVFLIEMMFGRISLFEYVLMMNYVFEMVCVDHSGSQLPFWSGCPYLPPLGYLLGFDKSIALHEAHHNFNRYSYGLLGVGDWLAGTRMYPAEYPGPHPKGKQF
ncbi:unnamed protein product [Vitrella brassicaformis CCMP3155]|uniref:Fatty acid hydroxylase domain-containing protein n=2 Tax=Vitrella brassicaformis TaxID=1169539 RepID=A0A0G4F360_VITBC|nr:unnamed protein product [Vitrella brassicaformis CCMP3155]|eukprot:CEM06484.1 unnamed protein product [Vitrella brassicaformis CCMP3155]